MLDMMSPSPLFQKFSGVLYTPFSDEAAAEKQDEACPSRGMFPEASLSLVSGCLILKVEYDTPGGNT
jgi:hypothetical protein